MLDIFFITSNRSKIEHAKYLCRDYNVNIHRQKQYGVGYIEPRIQDRKKLLEESIKDAVSRLKKVTSNFDSYFLLIEDTSVIIEALSSEHQEFPGLDVKYWMETTSFTEIDTALKSKNNNRSVIVRSDIVLFLPKVLQATTGENFCHFSSQSKGTITELEFAFTTNELYPWLSSRTFNKWFIPDGESQPISLLDIVTATKKDFRRGAFESMLSFLTSLNIIKHKHQSQTIYKQLNLFNLSLFIVCGLSCSGKTTIANYLTTKYGFYHIEASDFMYLSYYETHGPNSDVRIGDFARKALETNPSIVVDQIISHLLQFKKAFSIPVVISGFRSPQEIKAFKLKYRGDLDITEVFVDADATIRFERSVQRGRNDKVKTLDDFREIDALQNQMGLTHIRSEIPITNVIKNESSFQSYFNLFETRFEETLQFLQDKWKNQIESLKQTPAKLEHAILIAMAKERDTFLTTTEIAHLINNEFKFEKRKGKDNVSRYFNYKYHPFFEIHFFGEKVKYRLSQTGFSLASLLTKKYRQ